jgi:hypothetical protein
VDGLVDRPGAARRLKGGPLTTRPNRARPLSAHAAGDLLRSLLGEHQQAVTRDSSADNLRPIVPRTEDRAELLLWLRGSYRSYTDYGQEVVGMLGRIAPPQ